MRRAALRHRVGQRAAAAASDAQRAIRAAARAAVVAGRGRHHGERDVRSSGGGRTEEGRPSSSSNSGSGPARKGAEEGPAAEQESTGTGSAGQAGAEGVVDGRGARKSSGSEGRGSWRQGSARQSRQVATVGAQVVVKRLGRKGEVISVSEGKGEAVVRVGMMNVSVPLTEL